MLEDNLHHLELTAGRSNKVLSEKDLLIVRRLLSDIQLQLAGLDLEMSCDGLVSNTKLEHRAFLQKRMARFHIAVSPHKLLPPELWAQIFLLCLAENYISLPPNHLFPVVPWNISRVCSRWREIVYTEPGIWSSVDIDYNISKNGRKLTSFAHHVLSCSKESKLSLICREQLLLDRLFSSAKEPAPVAFTQNIVLKHARRIRNLEISSTLSKLASFLESPPSPMESLESVRISVEALRRRNIETITHKEMGVFGLAPALRRIEIMATALIRLLPDDLRLPWSQITDLCFDNVVLPQIMTFTMLMQCDNLVNCTLTLADNKDFMLSGLQNVQILVPHLSSLTILAEIAPLFAHFLNSVLLPSLKALNIKVPAGNFVLSQHLPQTELLAMVARSNCSLEGFSCGYSGPFDLPLLLHAMPDLRSLTLTNRPIDISVIEMMEHGDLVPQLESIQSELTSINPFLDLLETRWLNTNLEAEKPYEGIQSVNVQVYNLGDKLLEEAKRRLETFQPQFNHPGRNISINLSSETVWANR